VWNSTHRVDFNTPWHFHHSEAVPRKSVVLWCSCVCRFSESRYPERGIHVGIHGFGMATKFCCRGLAALARAVRCGGRNLSNTWLTVLTPLRGGWRVCLDRPWLRHLRSVTGVTGIPVEASLSAQGWRQQGEGVSMCRLSVVSTQRLPHRFPRNGLTTILRGGTNYPDSGWFGKVLFS